MESDVTSAFRRAAAAVGFRKLPGSVLADRGPELRAREGA